MILDSWNEWMGICGPYNYAFMSLQGTWTLLPTSTTMEIDGKYENEVELLNMGHMGVVMDMEKVAQASQRLDGVPMEVLVEGGNSMQGYKKSKTRRHVMK